VATEVCVVAYNSGETVPALVESLHLLPAGTSLAVHDNGPRAGTLDFVRAAAANAQIPFRGEACASSNCGFAAGCNALAAGSYADELLFLNPDARIVSWPSGLHADGRVVGARIRSAGRWAVTYGTTRRLSDEVRLRWLRRAPARPDGLGYVSGAALLVDRELFASLGGFDEGFFMYYEDIDLCHRAVAAGARVVLHDDWVVEHAGGHSVGGTTTGLTAAHLRSYQSGRRYHARHGHSVPAYDALCLVDAALRSAARIALPARRPVAKADWAVACEAARRLSGRAQGGERA
jgi:N-acetylglucosaminyl-diphospho-decaprenol L-rhamnosyltransferase